jgi:hypothetical protein
MKFKQTSWIWSLYPSVFVIMFSVALLLRNFNTKSVFSVILMAFYTNIFKDHKLWMQLMFQIMYLKCRLRSVFLPFIVYLVEKSFEIQRRAVRFLSSPPIRPHTVSYVTLGSSLRCACYFRIALHTHTVSRTERLFMKFGSDVMPLKATPNSHFCLHLLIRTCRVRRQKCEGDPPRWRSYPRLF